MKSLYSIPSVIVCCLLCSFSFSVSAKSARSGIVKDQKNKPLSYVTVLLLNSKDSSLVKGDYTNDKGEYKFEPVESGSYIISSSTWCSDHSAPFTIDDKNTDHKEEIILSSSNKALNEVKIVGKKPMIEVKADKTVFNV